MNAKKVSYDEYNEPVIVCCGNCAYSRVRFDSNLDLIYCLKHEAVYDSRFNRGCKDYYEVWY